MTRKELLRLQLRSMRFRLIDKLHDFANLCFPIFVTVGIIAASVRFWQWVFWR